MTDQIDHLIPCPGCSDYNGFPVFRHKTMFRVGRRNCFLCEVEEEVAKYGNLQTTSAAWKPSHGPKPLLNDPVTGEPI